MAGEGLFFTGVVYKNNRDILKEEAAREAFSGYINFHSTMWVGL